MSTTGTLTVTDATFAAEVLASDLPVLVDFWAQWCPPCHRLAPVLAEMAVEYAGRVRIVTMDADENPRTIQAYNIMAMPTLSVFRGGERVSQIVGAPSRTKLRELLDQGLVGGE